MKIGGSAASVAASGDIVAATAVRAQAIADARMSPGGRDVATVVVPDIQTANATVYVIDTVMMP